MDIFHLEPVRVLYPVRLGAVEYVATPFAVPVLPGWDAASMLSQSGGALIDVDSIARALHERAGMGGDTQLLYVFPRLLDCATLGRILKPLAMTHICEAICADIMTVAVGQPSRLVDLVPAADLHSAPLGFLFGMVACAPTKVPPLQLPARAWWPNSAAREECEFQLCAQFADHGVPVANAALPCAPSPLPQALVDGLVSLFKAAPLGMDRNMRVELEGADTVHVFLGPDPSQARLSLSRALLGESVVEHLLEALGAMGDGGYLRAPFRGRSS